MADTKPISIEGLKVFKQEMEKQSSAPTAEKVSFDDSFTSLGASNVQAAIEKVASKSSGGSSITTATLTAGDTTITIDGLNIQNGAALLFYTSIAGVSPTAISVANKYIELTFAAQTKDMIVGVEVKS